MSFKKIFSIGAFSVIEHWSFDTPCKKYYKIRETILPWNSGYGLNYIEWPLSYSTSKEALKTLIPKLGTGEVLNLAFHL